jgi:hypothetical protein
MTHAFDFWLTRVAAFMRSFLPGLIRAALIEGEANLAALTLWHSNKGC